MCPFDGWSPIDMNAPSPFIGKEITGNYTFTGGNQYIFADCSSGDITITLPEVTEFVGTIEVRIVKVDSSPNSVIINPSSTNLINGVSSFYISDQYAAVDLFSFSGGYYNAGGI